MSKELRFVPGTLLVSAGLMIAASVPALNEPFSTGPRTTAAKTQINIPYSNQPLYVDDMLPKGDSSLGVYHAAGCHIGTSSSGPSSATFILTCVENLGNCLPLITGGGYSVRRIRDNDPRAYPEHISVEVTFPKELYPLPGGARTKKVYWVNPIK